MPAFDCFEPRNAKNQTIYDDAAPAEKQMAFRKSRPTGLKQHNRKYSSASAKHRIHVSIPSINIRMVATATISKII